jgi:hypothetical protein
LKKQTSGAEAQKPASFVARLKLCPSMYRTAYGATARFSKISVRF